MENVLAPGSSVIKTDIQTSIIEERGKQEVTLRNSDFDNFGTKDKRQNNLKEYADRRLKKRTGKATEKLIENYARAARSKIEGGRKIKLNYR